MVGIYETSEKFKMELYRNIGFALCTPLCFMIGNAIMAGSLKPLSHWGLLFALVFFIIGFIATSYAMLVAMELDMLKSRNDSRNY